MEAKKRNIGVLYGWIAGLFMVLFSAALYKGGLNLYLSWVARLSYVVMIGLAVMATLKLRKTNGGWLDFQEALKTAFTVMALALAAHTFFTWVLLNFIDPHFKTILAQAVFEKTEELIREMHLSNDVMERTLADERMKDEFTFGRMSMGYAVSCIVYFMVALVIALIVRKKKNGTQEAGS
ncbi:MAG TPA: DUF4199 domain-containing protein [Puia sp.]|nr:DUF4199 domain-containing protein [Puia sp.]